MLSFHEAIAYCENITIGTLTLVAAVLAIWQGLPIVAFILCGTLLISQCIYKLVVDKHGMETLLACVVLILIGLGGAVYGSAIMMAILQLASVYDCWCHRKLHLTKDGIFTRRASIDAEASRDIGMGGCVPTANLFTANTSFH